MPKKLMQQKGFAAVPSKAAGCAALPSKDAVMKRWMISAGFAALPSKAAGCAALHIECWIQTRSRDPKEACPPSARMVLGLTPRIPDQSLHSAKVSNHSLNVRVRRAGGREPREHEVRHCDRPLQQHFQPPVVLQLPAGQVGAHASAQPLEKAYPLPCLPMGRI